MSRRRPPSDRSAIDGALPSQWPVPANDLTSLEPEPAEGSWLDRLGLLTVMAAALIVIAYAYPIWHHLQMPRFGSPGFSPF